MMRKTDVKSVQKLSKIARSDGPEVTVNVADLRRLLSLVKVARSVMSTEAHHQRTEVHVSPRPFDRSLDVQH